MRNWLHQVSGRVDLAVFPESMPFLEASTNVEPIESALKMLRSVSSDVSFIAGGYVNDGGVTRNAAFLVVSGEVRGEYFKRIPWQDEPFTPGSTAKAFEWQDYRCLPLICADIPEASSPQRRRMIKEALRLGVGSHTPIVVPTYGADLRHDYWVKPLKSWASGCSAPIAVCNIAGKSKHTFLDPYDDKRKPYGGGGSAVYWPDGSTWPPEAESRKGGIFLVELTVKGHGEFIPFG
jgi:predicted amidohydrolase